MDAIHFMKEVLSEPDLKNFLLMFDRVDDVSDLGSILYDLKNFHRFMTKTNFWVHPEDVKLARIVDLRLTASKVGNFMRENGNSMREILDARKNLSTISHNPDLFKKIRETLDLINGIMVSCNYLKQTEPVRMFKYKVVTAFENLDIKEVENLLLDTEDSCRKPWNEINSVGLLLIKAFSALGKIHSGYKRLTDISKVFDIFHELFAELENLPEQISKACEEQPLPLVLVGSLLSLKERAYHTWNKVKDDLCKIKESNNLATNNHMWHIFAYCYDDLPYFLKPCFLYLACYPIGYEIPAMSLTAIWVAERFIIPEKGETAAETANKYLEQLVERSLVLVSKRSILGTIKHCRVPRSLHEFVIQQSCKDGFLVANPDKEKVKSLFRFAIHHNDKNQYTEVNNNYMQAFLAFDFDRNVLKSPLFLRVLELRKSAISKNSLQSMIYLRYLGLRGSNISEIPENIGNMRNLLTLDVRDTNIKTLPESLWNISALCSVYVDPRHGIKGPPPAAPIPNLQTLKTVVVPESWLENNLHFPINFRKLALLIVNNLQWKYISNLLNHMVNLHSMTILAKSILNVDNNIPSEYVDARAFPILETVKSLKCEGKLNFRKLPIDNIKFPPNLIKLTLSKSGFKEDPMLLLEKLQALKFLILQDGAYTGKKMVCSAIGFPQLRFLELSKLENLEIWEVEPMAMPQLTTLHALECPNLINNIPNLAQVTDKVIHN